MGWSSNQDVEKVSDVDREVMRDIVEQNDSAYIDSIALDPINITYDVHCQFLDIMQTVPDREWGAMLDVDEEFDLVTDIFIPEQLGFRAEARVTDHESCQGYNGFIHSHHSMGLSFSKCDDEGVNSNYDYSLTICWEKKKNCTVTYHGSRRVHITDDIIVTAECDVQVLQPESDAGDRMEEVWEKGKYKNKKSKKNSSSKYSSSKKKRVGKATSTTEGKLSYPTKACTTPSGEIIEAEDAGEVLDAVLAGSIAIEPWILDSARDVNELLHFIDEHVLLADGTVIASAGQTNSRRLLEDFKHERA